MARLCGKVKNPSGRLGGARLVCTLKYGHLGECDKFVRVSGPEHARILAGDHEPKPLDLSFITREWLKRGLDADDAAGINEPDSIPQPGHPTLARRTVSADPSYPEVAGGLAA